MPQFAKCLDSGNHLVVITLDVRDNAATDLTFYARDDSLLRDAE
jgi:hypothetical protein